MIQLFDASGFMPRAQCGVSWTPGLTLVHEISDIAIFMCYVLIPLGIVALYRRVATGGDVRNKRLGIVLFFGFILTCGATHLMDRLMFQWPMYRLSGAVLLLCAAFSISTVAWLMVALGGTNGRN